MRIKCLYINTHAGQAIRSGGVAWARREFDPDLTFLNEVGREPAQAKVADIFNPKEYSITGLQPDGELVVQSGTLIIARRDVLKRKWWGNPLLSRQRWENGERDKWHPVRRLTRAFFRIPKIDGDLHTSCVHLWTHAGYPLHGKHEVPTEYRKQGQAYAVAAGQSARQNVPVLFVGDLNALPRDGDWLKNQFKEQGIRELWRHGVDGAFSRGLKLDSELRHILPGKLGMPPNEHGGFVFWVEI